MPKWCLALPLHLVSGEYISTPQWFLFHASCHHTQTTTALNYHPSYHQHSSTQTHKHIADFLSSTILPHNKPLARTFTGVSLPADTKWSRLQGLQHQQSTMTVVYSKPSSAISMSSPIFTRARTTGNAARPQRPGQPKPPQPRDGDTRHTYNAMNSSFSYKPDPQPRDPGNGRRSRDPHPRDPGGKRDPQPRDPGT